MKKQTETSSTATADGQSSRINKSSNANGALRLSVETVAIKQLKFGEGIEKGYEFWRRSLIDHVSFLPDIRDAIVGENDIDIISACIESAAANKLAEEDENK